ncbi:MAG: orotidine 5'-phosphate decarboxylase / HUMPS family protein [Promethearchaeota archaeon]
MAMNLAPNRRYIQLAFNGDTRQVRRILPRIPYDPRIWIEAGTPYIKREGAAGIHLISRYWRGIVVADLKITDGAFEEVNFAANAGARAITAMGSSPIATLNKFIQACHSRRVFALIDMLGVPDPLKKLMPLDYKPDGVIIHKGRDEESISSSIIRYRDISKIRGKYNVLMSVAGGLLPTKVRTAYFNGADIAILNIVRSSDPNEGINENSNFRRLIPEILSEVGN